MGEFSDRLVLLVIAGTALLVFSLGWAGGLVEAEAVGIAEPILLALLGGLALVLLIGIWFEFNTIDDEKG